MNSPHKPRSELAGKICAYWEQHPAASGTVESIVQWWLLEQQIREAVRDVEGALEELVSSGIVTRRQQLDGRMYYQLNQGASQKAVTDEKP